MRTWRLLLSESFDGFKHRGLAGGVDAGEDAAEAEGSESHGGRPGDEAGRIEAHVVVAHNAAEHQHESGGGGDADDAADAGEHEALKEELKEDAAVGSAESFAQAYLFGALGDGDEHDVDDADGTEGEGDDTDAAEKDVHGGEDDADGAVGLNRVPLIKGVEISGFEAVAAGDDLMDLSLGGLVGVFGGGLVVDATEGVEGLIRADEREVVDHGGDWDVEVLVLIVVVAAAALRGDPDDLEAKPVDCHERAERGMTHEQEIVGL